MGIDLLGHSRTKWRVGIGCDCGWWILATVGEELGVCAICGATMPIDDIIAAENEWLNRIKSKSAEGTKADTVVE